MFKKLKWKDILLAILTAAVGWLGGTEVYASYNASLESESGGKLIRTPDINQPAPEKSLYVVTAAFYEVDAIKVGNFTDVTIEDDLGPFTVRVEKDSPKYVEAEFKRKFPGYQGAKVRTPFMNVIPPKVPDKDKGDEDPDAL